MRFKCIFLMLMLFMLSACTFEDRAYNDDKSIASENNCSVKGYSGDLDEDQKGYHLKIEEMNGTREIARADVQKDCNVDISFLISALRGKLKIVHINPSNEVVNIKEIINGSNNESLENATIKCVVGLNKIKLVAENCSNINLRLRDLTQTFQYDVYNSFGQMFSKGFPFEK